MPNINQVGTVSTLTTSTSYFILSNNGLVKRIRYDNLITTLGTSGIQNLITDQGLFSSYGPRFKNLLLQDTADVSNINFGFVNETKRSGNAAVQHNDLLGAFKVGGWDGYKWTSSVRGLPNFALVVVAAEDFKATNAETTSSGVNWAIIQQPVGVKLDSQSRQPIITSSSFPSAGAGLPPTFTIRIGAMGQPSSPIQSLTSSDGSQTFDGPGGATVLFVNSKIYQTGIPADDSTAINATLTGTNVFSFIAQNQSAYTGYRNAILNNQTVGAFEFLAHDSNSSSENFPPEVARIEAKAVENFSPSARGTAVYIKTQNEAAANTVSTRAELRSSANKFYSTAHSFYDNSATNALTVTNGTVIFPDASIQSTAWNISASVPASSSSTGIAGQVAYSSNYIYVCVAANTWRRIAATTF